MDIKRIKQLIKLVEDSQISSLKLEEESEKIEISKASSSQVVTLPSAQPIAASPALEQAPVTAPSAVQDAPKASGGKEITSPMVGTFYAQASPEDPPFIKVGDSVSEGQAVCIVEAMKLFNEIESDCSGVIEDVLVKNGDLVEFGQPLFRVSVA